MKAAHLRALPAMRRIGACVLLCGCAVPTAMAADRFDGVRDYIRQRIDHGQTPSAAVAVIEDGRIVWEQGFGKADRERGIAASENTPYLLASVSKPIMATALMLLAQDQRLDLDAPVNDYLGDAPLIARRGDAKDATVRRVANHSSGLPVHYRTLRKEEPVPPYTDASVLLRYGNLITAPGDGYDYSNLGFGVLDRVIAKASGQNPGEFLRQRLFQPLGMAHTSYRLSAELESLAAIPYDEGKPLPHPHIDSPGAGEIYSSAHDLARFMQLHLKQHAPNQPAVLEDAWVDEMMRATPVNAAGAPGLPSLSRIGWGGDDNRVRNYRAVTKAGGMPGSATWMVLVPERRIAVVVLTNISWSGFDAPSYTIADEILKVLLPDWQPLSSEPWESEWEDIGYKPDPALAGAWSGHVHTYQGDVPARLNFLASGQVRMQLGDQPETVVEKPQLRYGWFRGDSTGLIGTDDARNIGLNRISLSLKLHGDRLDRDLMGYSPGITGDALSHWAELTRQP